MTEWLPGPPPGRGRWWIYWLGEDVLPVEISPAVIHPEGRLLLKTMGGVAYPFDANKDNITHHAPMVAPEPPVRGGSDG